MDALILTGVTAVRVIRTARRAYAALPWRLTSAAEQKRVLHDGAPNTTAIDLEQLERLGAWEGQPSEKLHVLVGDHERCRKNPLLQCRTISKALPKDSLYVLAPGIYCCVPALAALEYARSRSMTDVLILLMELLGTYSLAPESTLPISWGGTWPDDPEQKRVDQTHYRCEPVVTMRELQRWSRWATSSGYAPFRQASKLAAPKSASPAESIMYGMFALPKRYGSFGFSSLPKGGMQLNHRIDFTAQAVRMSSGMPYAVCDAYIPAANTDLEYNGGYHDKASSRIHDENRNNGLRGMGVKTIVLNNEQMRDIEALEAIAQSVYRDAKVRFQYNFKGFRPRQVKMLNALRRASGLRPV